MKSNYKFLFISMILFFLLTLTYCVTKIIRQENKILPLCGSGNYELGQKRTYLIGSKSYQLKENIKKDNSELNLLLMNSKETENNVLKIKNYHDKIDSYHLEIVSILEEEGDSLLKKTEYISAIESYLSSTEEISEVLNQDIKIKGMRDNLLKKIKDSHVKGEQQLFTLVKTNLDVVKINLQNNNKKDAEILISFVYLDMKKSPFLNTEIIAYYNDKAEKYKFREYNEKLYCTRGEHLKSNQEEYSRSNFKGANILKNSIGMEFVLIPSGEFFMGCIEGDSECNISEKPSHKVNISNSFYMGRYEVTLREWKAIMQKKPINYKNCRVFLDYIFANGEDCPVTHISFLETNEFIQKLCEKEKIKDCKYRLPTEAEWEYAARAGSKTKYYWGKDYSEEYTTTDIFDRPVLVGQKKPNDYGLYDMSGNVWEWTNDYYDENYYSQSPPKDPKGSSSGTYRVLRGGTSNIYGINNRTSYRYFYIPDSSSSNFGFRIIRTRD